MSNDSNWGQPPKQPKGYWDQGAEARARELKTFDYWNNTLFKVGQKKS